jgi:hypothetical protein
MDAGAVNEDVRNRIGEQKHACESLSELLNKFTDPSMSDLQKQLNELKAIYTNFTPKYVYGKPITDAKEKTTYFTSKSTVMLSVEDLAKVKVKIEAIRQIITQ